MASATPRRTDLTAWLCVALGAVTLGHAIQINNGGYDASALAWLTGALVLTSVGVLRLGIFRPLDSRADAIAGGVLAAGLGWQLISSLVDLPGIYLDPGSHLVWHRAGVLVEAGLIAAGALGVRAATRSWFVYLLATHMALGAWMIAASPQPRIDVVEVHHAAIDAVAHGVNPYTITFRNIYGADEHFYGAGATAGDRVLFGYPYPPLNLLIAAPGQLLLGDYRYAELAALIAAAGLIGFARRTRLGQLSAALLLTTPRGLFVIEQGWTEPIALLMLALVVFAMIRRPSIAGWMAGLLIVTKQYLGLALPLLWRHATKTTSAGRFAVHAAIAAAVATVPFLLWNVRAFVDTVVLLQAHEPFRPDSLSYLSWAAYSGWGLGTLAWALGAAAVTLVIALWRTPNTPAGLCGSIALVCFATFAFGSKAFCNYYFFVIGALCCTMAAWVEPAAVVERRPQKRMRTPTDGKRPKPPSAS